jgi:hypothetical protein
VEVLPREAGRCATYLTCVLGDGAAECMAAGGLAVCAAKSDAAPLVHGVNGLACASPADAAALAAAAAALALGPLNAMRSAAACVALLHGEAAFRWAWRGLLARDCLMLSGKPADAVALHERFLLLHVRARFGELMSLRAAPVDATAGRAVVYIDNREDLAGLLALLLTMANLAPGSWGVTVLCAPENAAFLRRGLHHLGPNVVFVELPRYHRRGFCIEDYNLLMKRASTWAAVARSAATALLVQSDGLLVRRGLEAHPALTRGHSYAGAPWRHHPYLAEATAGNLVGNGGLSLRRVSAALAVCEAAERAGTAVTVYPLAPSMSEAEDVFFARRLADVCPAADARTFSMEQETTPEALGYHRFWMYHPVDFTRRYFETLLVDYCSATQHSP